MIGIHLNEKLKQTLKEHGIEPEDYGPAYGGESIGLDLYYAGEDLIWVNGTGMHINELSSTPEKVLIPTGLRIALPKGYVAFIKDRGSISKTSLIRRAGVIDPGYTDEIFVNFCGTSEIKPGDKLPVQLVVIKAENDFDILSDDEFELLASKAKRKAGKVGSSDKK